MLFGCQYSASILFVGVVSVLALPPTNLPREYRVRRNFVGPIKGAEFSITDLLGKNLYYQIVSGYHLLKQLEVIRYPDKKKTARLGEKFWLFRGYRGEVSILDRPTNRWRHGMIERAALRDRDSYRIRWNGHDFNLTKAIGYRTYEFRNEDEQVLAHYVIHEDLRYERKFDMKIFSNEYPEELYFLGLAAHDNFLGLHKKGSLRWMK